MARCGGGASCAEADSGRARRPIDTLPQTLGCAPPRSGLKAGPVPVAHWLGSMITSINGRAWRRGWHVAAALGGMLPFPALAADGPAVPAAHGDVAWVLAASALVLFMTLPGLALFYGGLVR